MAEIASGAEFHRECAHKLQACSGTIMRRRLYAKAAKVLVLLDLLSLSAVSCSSVKAK